jgi:hypothetical protein
MTCLLTMMIETEQTIQKATQQAALIACAVAEGVLAPMLLLLLPSTGDGVRVDGSGLYSAPMLVVLQASNCAVAVCCLAAGALRSSG